MTSLIFYTDEQQIAVGTDTLATTVDGTPAFFTTKAFPLPHLRMVIAGTGMVGFLLQWFAKINDGMRLGGIDNLDFHAPSALTSLWAEFQASADYTFTEDLTTTVYHFGFSEADNGVRSYAYRSTTEFVSESLQTGGFGVKPPCEVPENWTLPDDLITMMESQRAAEEPRPIGERIFIGGEIQFLHLTREAVSISTVHRFDGYEQDLVTILKG